MKITTNFTERRNLPVIVELKNICQSYDGGKTFAVKDFNFLIEDKPNQGQFIVIVGASGCGKSTILRYVSGLQKPTSGEILLNNKYRIDADRIGMVFQKYSCLPWLTALENVALGLKFKGMSKKERTEKALQMIETVGLKGHEWKYAKYPTMSGGQLQRVAIAQALLNNSKIMLCDEPFAPLDVANRLKAQDLILKIWQDLSKKDEEATVIFVTHDIPEAVYLGDEIYIMGIDNGVGHFIEKIEPELPKDRNKLLKRDKNFLDCVAYIEDKVIKGS